MAAKKTTGLGRGLGALLGDDAMSAEPQGTLRLPISQVESNSAQPRKYFDEAALAELANSIAQHAAAVALTSGGKFVELMRREYSERRLLMHNLLNDIPGLSCELPKGAFYMMLNLSSMMGRKYLGREIKSSMEFADALLESQRVAIVPGNAFGADMHARLSYAVSRDSITRGIARIAAFVAELE